MNVSLSEKNMAECSRQRKHLLSTHSPIWYVQELLVTCLGYNLEVSSGVGYTQPRLPSGSGTTKINVVLVGTIRDVQSGIKIPQLTISCLPSPTLPPLGKPNWKPIGKGAKEM